MVDQKQMARVDILLDLLRDTNTDCFRKIINKAWPGKEEITKMSDAQFDALIIKIQQMLGKDGD